MKKLFLCLIILIPIFAGCNLQTKESKQYYQTVTLINQTNQSIRFSLIYDTTTATSSNAFYSQSHNYVSDFAGFVLKQQLISPAGSVSSDGQYRLDRNELKLKTGSYYVTLFLCKNNMYTGKQDEYINKKRIYISGDQTVIIASNGAIY